MGILLDKQTGRLLTLPGQCVVGRSSACFIRIADPKVSSEHARIYWSGKDWALRDLGSRNGSTVNGRLLEAGAAQKLTKSDLITFGNNSQAWTLIDDSGPSATAREPSTGKVITTRDGLLTFPGGGPHPYVYQGPDDLWILEDEDEQRVVQDGDIVNAAGRHWILHLPSTIEGTMPDEQQMRRLSQLHWLFSISGDEEFVHVQVRDGKQLIDLGSRAHHYMLLILSRCRAQDEDPLLGGWLYGDKLCTMLSLDEQHLNVQIFRAREELGQLGVSDAAGIIERRRSTKQLRSGIKHFSEKGV